MSDTLDNRVRALVEAGDTARATELILGEYGREIMGYLVATLRPVEHAEDAFSAFAERVWRGIGDFEGRASLRTWCYVIARNAGRDVLSAAWERRRVPLPSDAAEALVDELRTQTAAHLRTEIKDAIRALREQLDPEERELLVLRVDRGLEWRDIAAVLAPEDDARQASSRLRKQFERLTQKIRQLADRAGLLDPGNR